MYDRTNTILSARQGEIYMVAVGNISSLSYLSSYVHLPSNQICVHYITRKMDIDPE